MKSQYVDEPMHFSPKKGLLTIRLPKKVVAEAFHKLSRKGIVTRITHLDGANRRKEKTRKTKSTRRNRPETP